MAATPLPPMVTALLALMFTSLLFPIEPSSFMNVTVAVVSDVDVLARVRDAS